MHQAIQTTRTVASFCSAFNFRSLPKSVVELAKAIVLDTLGALNLSLGCVNQ